MQAALSRTWLLGAVSSPSLLGREETMCMTGSVSFFLLFCSRFADGNIRCHALVEVRRIIFRRVHQFFLVFFFRPSPFSLATSFFVRAGLWVSLCAKGDGRVPRTICQTVSRACHACCMGIWGRRGRARKARERGENLIVYRKAESIVGTY